MIKSITRIIVIGLLAAITITVPVRSQTDDKGTSAPSAEKSKKSASIPFTGKLNAVDKTAMTITLEGKEKKRTIHLTSQTRYMKAGKPATLDDAVVGEEVAGQIVKKAEGQEEAVSLRLGPKPEEAPKEKKAKKEKEPAK
jgi:hypothetical protein